MNAETTVYPLMEEKEKLSQGHQVAQRLRQEHQTVKNSLYQIDKMSLNDPSFDSLLNQCFSEFDRMAFGSGVDIHL